jgi:dTMP kinase
MPKRGKFITFEGLDGCGKSTQLHLLGESLRQQGYDVIETREPGGPPISEQIRALLLSSKTEGLAPLAELALNFASRAQQLEQVIRPALAAGTIVLCDRFTDSSEAYQGGGRQLGSRAVMALHRTLCGNLWPDLTILLMTDMASVDRARKRNIRNQDTADEGRYERENDEFYRRVRKSYLGIARREKRVAKIEAGRPIPEVSAAIARIVRKRLGIGK